MEDEVDEWEEKYQVLQEFVFKKLISIEQRLNVVENDSKDFRDKLKELQDGFTSVKEGTDETKSLEKNKIEMAEKKIEDTQGSTNSNLHQIKTLQKSLNETGTASCQLDNSDDELMPLSQSTPIPETSEGNPFSVTVTPSSSTKRFTIPKCVKDVSDLELRKKLEATEHQVKYVRHREKLSYCQLVYIYYWLDKNNEKVSGRSEQTLRLIRNGERDMMWTKSWKPPGSRLDLFNYLQEILKNMAKRERLNDYKESLIVGDKNKSAATTDSL